MEKCFTFQITMLNILHVAKIKKLAPIKDELLAIPPSVPTNLQPITRLTVSTYWIFRSVEMLRSDSQ